VLTPKPVAFALAVFASFNSVQFVPLNFSVCAYFVGLLKPRYTKLVLAGADPAAAKASLG